MSQRILRRMFAVSLVAALLAWVGSEAVHAAMQDKGTLSGRVVTADGKPATGLALRLEQQIPMGMERGGRKPKSAWDGTGAVELQGMKVVARTTTDKDGRFTFSNLAPGAYILVGGSKSMGWIYYPVDIEAGKEVKLEEIKLHKE